MKTTKGNNGQPIYEWLKNPSSWISLIAVIISIFTFFLVYADKGTIKVLLPHRIGIGISSDTSRLHILVPATFSNTGAPVTRRHIRHITGWVKSLDEKVPLDALLQWDYENKFVGREEFLRRYPTEEDVGGRDNLVYEGRAIPFTIKGGESITKIVELRDYGARPSDLVPSDFQFELILHTESGDFKESYSYKCPSKSKMNYYTTWCTVMSQQK